VATVLDFDTGWPRMAAAVAEICGLLRCVAISNLFLEFNGPSRLQSNFRSIESVGI
jgi:hypothetical protein